MIRAKITGKNGAALEQDLPLAIPQLHQEMYKAGITKSPRNILLKGDKDVNVQLSADSEIGNRLLRVFGKEDTLADAHIVAFAVSSAREEILLELEQNITSLKRLCWMISVT